MSDLFTPACPPPAAHHEAHVLRPYQSAAVEEVLEQWETVTATLVVLPTGTGKTQVFCDVLRRSVLGRAIVLAHREELIDQAARRIAQNTGLTVGVEQADRWTDEYQDPPQVVVSTIQTQIAGLDGNGRMSRYNPWEFGIAVIDEAHHAPADSYRKVVKHYRQNHNLKLLGVTATPDRADEKALGQVFDSVAYVYEIDQAVRDGWLVPINQASVFVESLNLSAVGTVAGDLNQGQLDTEMKADRNVHGVVGPTLEIAAGRKTLVFASGVGHAERLVQAFNSVRPGCADWVIGETDRMIRRQVFADFAAGKTQVLVNVGVATEGFDEPGIGVVAVARPTKSRALYAQMIGRGTRPLPGLVDGCEDAERHIRIAESTKPRLDVIDFVGNAGRHKLMSAADVLGGNYDDEVIELAKRRIERKAKAGKAANVADELREAEHDIHERHKRAIEARRRTLIDVTYRKKSVNPFDVLDLEPQRERGWNAGRMVTEKQAATLAKFGVDNDTLAGLSFTKAHQLLDEMFDRCRTGKSTFKQCALLGRYGIDANAMTRNEASKRIDAIKANGWKLPK